jgi:ammonia channel protein AmtB
MPGVLGGLGGIFSALTADESIVSIYPYRGPSNITIARELGLSRLGYDRDENQQAGYQAAALLTSIAMGVIGGLITAFLIRLPCVCRVDSQDYYLDKTYFHELPPDHPAKNIIASKEEPNIQVDIDDDKDDIIHSSNED